MTQDNPHVAALVEAWFVPQDAQYAWVEQYRGRWIRYSVKGGIPHWMPLPTPPKAGDDHDAG